MFQLFEPVESAPVAQPNRELPRERESLSLAKLAGLLALAITLILIAARTGF